ncbi:MAG: hypothetical protein K2M54_02965 [Muribaculaceae bacterium]|nr:hypothetical protein [Muribaculaceae bacterium]
MDLIVSIRDIRIILQIIFLISIGINTSAQSPYAVFGDNSEMLEAKSLPTSLIYSIEVRKTNGNSLYAYFDLNKGIVTLFDTEDNIFMHDSISISEKAMFTTVDPHAGNYYNLNTYTYCGGNPINAIDIDGKDWYQNNQTSYYTWFDGDEEREGFTYIGGKGCVLGEEFENILNNVLCGKDGLGLESLYSNGFTFDIAPIDKGGLIGSKERGWDFFDEFVDGSGPEFTVLLENHPYTQAIMNDDFAVNSQNIVRSRGKNGQYTNVGRSAFFPWQASLLSPMQFIGTYRYDGYSSNDGKSIYNIATDSKSVTSLGYHIPFLSNHRRSKQNSFGNTYQFYLWKSTR